MSAGTHIRSFWEKCRAAARRVSPTDRKTLQRLAATGRDRLRRLEPAARDALQRLSKTGQNSLRRLYPVGRWSKRAGFWVWRPAAAGLSAAAAFPLVIPPAAKPLCEDFPREAAIFIGAALLFDLTQRKGSMRGRIVQSFVGGLFFFSLLLYWLMIAMVTYGGMAAWQAALALTLLCLYCASFWALVPVLTRVAAAHARVGAALGFACAVVTLEWLRGVMLTGFPWGLWGYSQARNLLLVQLASLGGVYAVTFVIALAGAWLREAVTAGSWQLATRPLARAGLLLIVAHGMGWVILAMRAEDPALGMRVAVVQGNIEQSIKNRDAVYGPLIRERYETLTKEAVDAGAELVVWPESAWPGSLKAGASRLSKELPEKPLLIGASLHEDRTSTSAYNSALFVDELGWIQGRYHKRHLVPFGEYVPLREILPVERVVPGVVEFEAGRSAEPIGKPAIGVLICYDGIFPSLSRESVSSGAKVLANLTNDGWYGFSSAPHQHRDFYVFRAAETDRWLIRAANSGISAFIAPTGTITSETSLGTTAVLFDQVWPRNTLTPYVRWGDWLAAAAIGVILGGVSSWLLAMLRRRERADDNQSPLQEGVDTHEGLDAVKDELHKAEHQRQVNENR